MEEEDDYEVLSAFERRLLEVATMYSFTTLRWRIILAFLTKLAIIGVCSWLGDQNIVVVPQRPLSHPEFTVAVLAFIMVLVLD